MADLKSEDEALLQRAYDLKGEEDTRQLYQDWAKTYDRTMVDNLTYKSPRVIGELMARFLDDKQTHIADIGCGTGLTGQAIYDLGFGELSGLDFSDQMLAVAKERGIYKNLINADLLKPLDIETGKFGGAISSGIFTHGHLDADCLSEIFRIIQPGGLFACVVRVQVWQEMGFGDAFDAFEQSGKISRLADEFSENYENSSDADGRYLVFKKSA